MDYKITHITDQDIQALVDNELDQRIARYVKNIIVQNTEFLQRYEELKKQKSLLQKWWLHKNYQN